MARSNVGQYKATYAKLLRLYPKSYQQRFAEPMRQMFADMCHEREQNGQDTRGFAYKIYAETFTGVLAQHIQEVVMNIKTAKSKIIVSAGLVGVIAIGALLTNYSVRAAQTIEPGLGLKQVQALSKGTKSACLADVRSAADAVKRDDGFMELHGNKFSNFEMTEGGAIADVPAGTNYDLTINSYTDNTVKGTLTYEKGYGTYNYTTQKLPAHGQWKLISIVACKQS